MWLLITRQEFDYQLKESQRWPSDALESLRLHLLALPGQNLMRIHFAESLRALGRLGGGISADDGQTSAQPWFLSRFTLISSLVVQ